MGSNPTLNEIVDELEELSNRDTPNIEFEPMDGYPSRHE